MFQAPRYNRHIDLVHVDGAHSVEQSMFDATNWLTLLRPGGYLVLDDINWPTVGMAHEYLKAAAILVFENADEAGGHFAIFRKR
jgi:hypothetical protein